MFKEMNKKEKMELIFSMCVELEDKGFYPLQQCIGLGECIIGNKLRSAGKGIEKYMEIALDRLLDKGLPFDEYSRYSEKLR